ncbi:hypothetical protein KDW07_15215 [Burkholderia dolosa]|uniref:hypothetical protein n=1 Tax=Burkholderia dolosa TaxID=152500 RepID=UPI001BA3DCB6|nr:hypothetical protein [Burkholderia dolosa]MBR8458495.1 hypothetical protein [Burkholderia dolosa]MDN7423147.1 hypothetical protein [Burkholderia dolosa]
MSRTALKIGIVGPCRAERRLARRGRQKAQVRSRRARQIVAARIHFMSRRDAFKRATAEYRRSRRNAERYRVTSNAPRALRDRSIASVAIDR